jgi:ketosteroid isomerase-like protein
MGRSEATEVRRTAIVQGIYANMNQGDVAAALQDFAEDASFIELPGRVGGRDCHGRAELAAYFATARATWAEGTCAPMQIRGAGGDRMLVIAHVHVRLKGAAEWLDGDVGDVFTFRGDKVIAFHSFDDTAQALAHAGLPPDALIFPPIRQ